MFKIVCYIDTVYLWLSWLLKSWYKVTSYMFNLKIVYYIDTVYLWLSWLVKSWYKVTWYMFNLKIVYYIDTAYLWLSWLLKSGMHTAEGEVHQISYLKFHNEGPLKVFLNRFVHNGVNSSFEIKWYFFTILGSSISWKFFEYLS